MQLKFFHTLHIKHIVRHLKLHDAHCLYTDTYYAARCAYWVVRTYGDLRGAIRAFRDATALLLQDRTRHSCAHPMRLVCADGARIVLALCKWIPQLGVVCVATTHGSIPSHVRVAIVIK